MSTEKQTYESISLRLRILIDFHTNGNLKKFAELSDINPVTLLNYSKGRIPKADALANICESFNVNINWLLTGRGSQHILRHDSESQPLDPNPEIADLIAGARRVLTSGNHAAFDALERNIRYFDIAVTAEKRVDEMEKEMKEGFKILKEEITRLKRENSLLDMDAEEQSLRKKVA